MTDLRFKTPPPGREAIETAIQVLIDLLDALTPDSDFEPDADQWEDDDERDRSWCERLVQTLPHTGHEDEDMEEDDPSGGAVDDEPHDQAMEVTLLNRGAHTTGRRWGMDQRFIERVHGWRGEHVTPGRSEAWQEAEYPRNRAND